MDQSKTTEEAEQALGLQMRTLRLRRSLDQVSLALRAGIALNALKHLERGQGATIKTLVRVLKALDRLDWLETLAPPVSISPLDVLRSRPERQRVYRKRKKDV